MPVGHADIYSGRVELLRWVREHGCDWNEATCAEAALGGHLEVLMWAREHGCPWVEASVRARARHVEVLRWLDDYEAD